MGFFRGNIGFCSWLIAEDCRFASAWQRNHISICPFWLFRHTWLCPASSIRRWKLGIGDCRRTRFVRIGASFLTRRSTRAPHIPQNFTPGSLTWLQALHFMLMPDRADASLHLPPLQPHPTHAAKFMFRTVLSTAEGTKHEVLNSFDPPSDHTCPKTAAPLLLG